MSCGFHCFRFCKIWNSELYKVLRLCSSNGELNWSVDEKVSSPFELVFSASFKNLTRGLLNKERLLLGFWMIIFKSFLILSGECFWSTLCPLKVLFSKLSIFSLFSSSFLDFSLSFFLYFSVFSFSSLLGFVELAIVMVDVAEIQWVDSCLALTSTCCQQRFVGTLL